jgi:acetyl-CoA C-acetyltransferase
MRDVVIVEAGRSPVGKRDGSLGNAHPTDVLGQVMMGVLDRAGVKTTDVGQVVGGCINKVGAQAMNVTRTAWLAHGGDENTACITVDSQCGSSQHATTLGHSLIASGMEDIVLACGVENMTLLPVGADAVAGVKAGMGKPIARSYREHHEFISQFEGAERIAEKYQISRQDTDAFGLESQLRAAKAIEEGRFEAQIIPVASPVVDDEGKRTDQSITVTKDEVPRDTSLEALAGLKPVAREDGVHTAGTSSQIADGAAAVLLMSAEKAAALGVKPIARIVNSVLVGCDPVLMLEGPIPATEKLLQEAGLSMDDIDVVEINEAFASVVLAWAGAVGANLDKVNPNGGAISLGHPLGGTGCVLITKAVHELQRAGGEYGIVTMCCGGGLGTGTLLQRV